MGRAGDLKVTAMLAWFDEPTGLLTEAVESAAVIADKIVAVDGAYSQTPGAKATSPRRQADAIRRAACKAGMACTIIRSGGIWTGQVAKRSFMINWACRDSDWVFPLDADWVVTGDREAIRAELAASDADEFMVRLSEPLNPDRHIDGIPTHQWHKDYAGSTEWIPLIYRSLDDMKCERIHWSYTGVKDGERIGLWGGKTWWPPGVTEYLEADCMFEHRCLFRDDKQIIRNVEYAAVRELQVQQMRGDEL